MDQTTRPLLIPPQFALYAEKHAIFELYQRILSHLIMYTPEDPLTSIIEFLKKDNDSQATIIIGPPASGKKTLSRLLQKKTGAVLLTQANLIESASNAMKVEMAKEIEKNKLTPQQWAKIIKQRIDEYDCVRKGWILENYPTTRAQSLALLTIGVLPKHSVVLEAPDSMLIERAAGKRLDPNTGEIYHTTFDWPADVAVQQRLIVPENNREEALVNRLMIYNRHIGGIKDSLNATTKLVNVDQPKGDVFNIILDFVSRPARSHAPITPRILLIGPYGSGRRTQAKALANKYEIVDVSISSLIKEAIAHETVLGLSMKPHFDKKSLIPDSLIIPLLKERLSRLDCVSRGWVLHGFPKSRDQAEALDQNGFSPNRVFFMDIPNDSIIERTTLRYLDPVSGERYHVLFNPPPTQEVRDRLVQKPSDSETNISRRITEYYSEIRSIIDYYEENSLHINADQDPNIVFECIESGVVNRLPKQNDD